jgi:hypothetical protein
MTQYAVCVKLASYSLYTLRIKIASLRVEKRRHVASLGYQSRNRHTVQRNDGANADYDDYDGYDGYDDDDYNGDDGDDTDMIQRHQSTWSTYITSREHKHVTEQNTCLAPSPHTQVTVCLIGFIIQLCGERGQEPQHYQCHACHAGAYVWKRVQEPQHYQCHTCHTGTCVCLVRSNFGYRCFGGHRKRGERVRCGDGATSPSCVQAAKQRTRARMAVRWLLKQTS